MKMFILTAFLLLLFAFEQKAFAISNQTENTQNNIKELSTEQIKRQINANEHHYYSINLLKDQFVYIDLNQQDVDLGITFSTSDGQEINSNAGDLFRQPEPFYWIAQQTGNYKLIVKNGESSNGSYTIQIGELRKKTDNDTHFILGQKKLGEAEKFRIEGKKESLLNAIDAYKEAVEQWKIVNQNERQGVCLIFIGEINYFLGNKDIAINYINQGINILPICSAKVQGFADLGHIADDPEESLVYHTRCLQLNETLGDNAVKVNCLNGIANAYENLGRRQEALATLNQTLTLCQKIGNTVEEGTTLSNMGHIFLAIQEYEKAEIYFDKALKIWEKLGLVRNTVFTLSQKSGIYLELRQLNKAFQIYDLILNLTEKTGQKAQRGFIFKQMGQAFFYQKKYGESLQKFQEALEMLKDPNNQTQILRQIGADYWGLGEKAKALEYYDKAYEESKKIDYIDEKLNILYQKALLYRDVGQLELAITNIKEGVEIYESVKLKTFSEEINIFQSAKFTDLYRLYISLLMDLHQKDPSKNYNIEALKINETLKSRTLLEFINESGINIQSNIDISLLDKEKQTQKILIKKTDNLRKVVSQQNYSKDEKFNLEQEIYQLSTELDQVRAKIRETNPQYVAIKDPKPLTLEQIQNLLDTNTTLLEYCISKDSSYLWVINKNKIKSYVLPKQLEIEQIASSANIYFRTHHKPESQESIEEEKALYSSFLNLSSVLLGQVGQLEKRLLIVNDGPIENIPFGALLEGKDRPLILNHEIVLIPSISTLALLRKNFTDRKPAPKSILVFGDPVFSSKDTRLADNIRKKENIIKNIDNKENTENFLAQRMFERNGLERLNFGLQEAEAIQNIYADENPKILLGTKADLAAATNEDVGNYKIIHYIAHGFIDADHPEFSGIVLSLVDDEGNEKPGYLTTNHLLNQKINADLVVLSACQTGFGKQVRGEGVLGLSRSFFYAGAKRVIFTLWNINDESTSVLMTKFYTEMKKNKLSPSAALREAQIYMLKSEKWKSPYYWAAFQIEGDF